MWPRVDKATLVNSTFSFLLSFCYRSTTVNGNPRCSLACLPRYLAATRQDVALSFFIPPYIVLQAERAIANTVFTPSINPTRGVIIQPQVSNWTGL